MSHVDLASLPRPDRKRKRASWFSVVNRIWFRAPDGRTVRALCVDFWDRPCVPGVPYEPREFTLRLANTDPRPRGLHAKGMEWSQAIADFYLALPIGQWIETVPPEPASIARDRAGNQLLLTDGRAA